MNREELTLLGLMRRRAEIAEERLREANLEPSRPMRSIHNYVRDLAIKHGVDPDALPPAEEHNDPAEEIDRMLLAGPEGRVQSSFMDGGKLPYPASSKQVGGDRHLVGDAGGGEGVEAADRVSDPPEVALREEKLEQRQPTKERAPWRFQRTRGIPEKKEPEGQGGDEAAGRHAPAGDGR